MAELKLQSNPKYSVILPVYCEQAAVQEHLAAIENTLYEKLGPNFEVLVVENGSREISDNPESSFSRTVATQTRGRGAAFKLGMQALKGDYAFVLAIDRAWDENFVFDAIKELEQGADVVFGQKTHPRSVVTRPWIRGLGSFCIRLFNWVYFHIPYQDTQCVRAFRVDSINYVDVLSDANYFSETEFYLRARENKLKIAVVPVTVHDRRKNSKVTFFSLFEYLKEAFRYRSHR